jgi:hypothetical protein
MKANHEILALLKAFFLPVRRSYKGRDIVDASSAELPECSHEFQQVCNRIFCAVNFCVVTIMQGETSYIYRAIVHLFQGEEIPQLPGCT